MDTVFILDLHTQAVIGAYESEQHTPQPLILDIELRTDFSHAFRSDDLNDALNYDEICQRIRAFCKDNHYQLLEALAGGLLELLFGYDTVEYAVVSIRKPQALQQATACVRSERSREQWLNR